MRRLLSLLFLVGAVGSGSAASVSCGDDVAVIEADSGVSAASAAVTDGPAVNAGQNGGLDGGNDASGDSGARGGTDAGADR